MDMLINVTAQTKKLKAKWTPELGQDLNAYHNLDAEVELTQILSEQIALEIDREILEDLVLNTQIVNLHRPLKWLQDIWNDDFCSMIVMALSLHVISKLICSISWT